MRIGSWPVSDRRFRKLSNEIYEEVSQPLPRRNMSTDWLGPRIYRPNLEEVLRGAIRHPPRTFTTLLTSGIPAWVDS